MPDIIVPTGATPVASPSPAPLSANPSIDELIALVKSQGAQLATLKKQADGDFDITKFDEEDMVIVGTPGRVMDHLERGTLNLEGVRFVRTEEVASGYQSTAGGTEVTATVNSVGNFYIERQSLASAAIRTCDGGTSNSRQASMISSPLLSMVAGSMVIRRPITQVGCLSACSGVMEANSASGSLRKGPPEAVSQMVFTSA